MPIKDKWRIALLCASVFLLLCVGGNALWLDRQFEEPEAKYIPSLVAHLGVQSVLGVFAHPDDEIPVAGLLSNAADLPEIAVRTITVTQGEAGIGKKPISKPEHLALIRAAELYKFGYILRLDDQEIWTYHDGKLAEEPIESMIKDIVSRIRLWKPDLVVTFDPATGLTLSSDHMTVGGAATVAFRAAGDPMFDPSIGEPYEPRWLAYVVAPRRILERFGGEKGRRIAEKQPIPHYAIPGNRLLKTRGWEIHESQRHVIQEIFGVPPWFLYSFYDKEHYYVLGQIDKD